MTADRFKRAAFVALLTLAGTTLAHAHPGHPGHDLTHGLAHPFTGLDHLLAMLAVGLWAAQLGGRARWALPVAFVSLMAAGGFLGLSGVALPHVEQGILASVFVLGLALLLALRLPLIVSVALTGLFAVFHGYAHGAEMPAASTGFAYGVGMLFSTALLHACGLCVGLALQKTPFPGWLRVTGAAILAGGCLIALS